MLRRWPLTARGTGAVVLAIGCLVLARELGSAELLYVACLLIALVVASLIALRVGYRGGRVDRVLHPTSIAVGETALVDVTAEVASRIPTSAGVWRDLLPAGIDGDAEGALPSARGDGRLRWSYEVTAHRRGVHRIGPLALRVTDPFGVARRTVSAGAETRVTVVPATVGLAALTDTTGAAGGSQASTSERLGQGADNLIARPYAPGDSMRRIHWRATAHRDQLMVREEEQESTPEATVVLDRSGVRWHVSARHAAGADPAFENALVACVSVVERLSSDGYVVEVLDADGTPLVAPVPGGESAVELDELRDVLATITTERGDALPALPPLFTGGATGPLVVITGKLTEADAEVLAPLAHHSALPVLLTADAESSALATLSRSWRTGVVRDRTEIIDAWNGIVENGSRHVVA